MQPTLSETDFHFPGQKGKYTGKVRDVYDFADKLIFVTTDRYSAFDRNLAVIPHKGELLTAISKWWFEQTAHIVPNHVIGYPDPNVVMGKKYKVVPIEMIVRGYITGVTNTSLWHTYSEGQREYDGFTLPDGLRKNEKLPQPVLTPTTKFEVHDRNISVAEAINDGLIVQALWDKLAATALELFTFGQAEAAKRGLVLVDTKYEFGTDDDGNIVLIDEIHTPDSSRYWLLDSYEAQVAASQEPDNYDKEFLRLWFKERFDPYGGAAAPEAPADVIAEMSRRNQVVYEKLTGTSFTPAASSGDIAQRIEQNILQVIKESNA